MALKDKLMTLEDFKAVRDVDVASNSAQFTEIKADLGAQAESIFRVPYVPQNIQTEDGVIKLFKGYIGQTTGAILNTNTGKYYRTQAGGTDENDLILIGGRTLAITLGLDWVEWNCWSYNAENTATHSNTPLTHYAKGTDTVYVTAESPDTYIAMGFRKTGAGDSDRTAFTSEELNTLRNAIQFWNVTDDTLSVRGAIPDSAAVGEAIRASANKNNGLSLDSVAIENKKYSEVFFGEYNLLSPIYFDAGTIAPATVGAGSPEIIDHCSAVTQCHKVLKCFGNVSTQIAVSSTKSIVRLIADHVYFCALCLNVSRYSAGKAGMLLQSDAVSLNYLLGKTSVTDGWEVVTDILAYDKTTRYVSCYMGTANSANSDTLLAMPVIIDLTAMGVDVSDESAVESALAEMKRIYTEYIAITDTPDLRQRRIKANEQAYCGATMDAETSTTRFLAMKELFDIARKKTANPYYTPKTAEHPNLVRGVVCALPPYNAAGYEKYSYKLLYAVDATVQAPPASTTKVITAITALPYIDNIFEQYTIESGDVIASSGNTYQAGDILTVKDMLHAMFLESSNTCANGLGTMAGRKILRNQSASLTDARAAFMTAVNARAAEIGCENSHFSNPSGVARSDQLATSLDLLRILIEASSYTDILRVWNKKSYAATVGGTNSRSVTITSIVTNETLENDYYIIGGKTGSLDSGPKTLVMIAMPK